MANPNIDAVQLLGNILGNGAMSKGSGANILQTVLGGMGSQQQVQQGGLDGLLGSSGLGGLLGAVLGGAQPQAQQPQMQQPQVQQMPQQQQSGYKPTINITPKEEINDQAALLIKAMCNAAKADGKLDEKEQQAIMSKLEDVSQQEIDFVRQELASPLDVQAFARSIPRGLEQQVYAVSLMAIDLDTNPEAQYLHQLAQSTGLNPQVCNQIHQQLGAPSIYR